MNRDDLRKTMIKRLKVLIQLTLYTSQKFLIINQLLMYHLFMTIDL
jgi:hypothetical protein